MRAMVLERSAPAESAPLVLHEVPDPEPAAGEVRVRVSVCAVCRTDLHVVEEDLPPVRRPVIPGHQAVGRIDRVGAGVPPSRVGERVGIAWLRSTCGACRFCASGRENLCLAPGFTGWHADGGFAELAVVPAGFAYPIPDRFGDEEAAPLLCAGVIGHRALRLSGVAPGGRLGLFGFGASAHVVLQVARARGCEVFVSSLRPNHRDLARRLGAAWTGGADERPPVPLDGAILFAPAGELVPAALRSLDRGGTLACAGIHMTPIPRLDYDGDLFQERVLRSVTSNTRADALDFLREAASIPVRTHTVPYALADANRALADLKAGVFDGAAALRMGG